MVGEPVSHHSQNVVGVIHPRLLAHRLVLRLVMVVMNHQWAAPAIIVRVKKALRRRLPSCDVTSQKPDTLEDGAVQIRAIAAGPVRQVAQHAQSSYAYTFMESVQSATQNLTSMPGMARCRRNGSPFHHPKWAWKFSPPTLPTKSLRMGQHSRLNRL